jgi:hypothetical protein
MRGDRQLICVRHKSGKAARIPRSRADELVNRGAAEFINNTQYRAAKYGVEVKPKQTEAQIKTMITLARSKAEAKAKAERERKERQEKDSRQRRKTRKKDETRRSTEGDAGGV